MNPQGDGGFAQERASNCPLLCGNNFAHRCSLMKMLIIDQDLKILDIIKNDPKQPKVERDRIRVSRCETDYTQSDLELVAKKYKAINLLYCRLNGDESKRIFTYTSA
ncbi:unnamed protein product [Amaranthus hypochondriacus]